MAIVVLIAEAIFAFTVSWPAFPYTRTLISPSKEQALYVGMITSLIKGWRRPLRRVHIIREAL